MASIEIDGKKCETQSGKMIIEIADEMGINIPRFCYHKKLSVAANCRMCLVEVEKSRKPLPACATPVTDGMKVFTKSPMAIAAQKAVMEFLLINHPLDCPICDQGGECELQDVSMGYGGDISRFTEGKRAVEDENIGPLVATEMTRCIHCTRCVRFGEEVAGLRELGATGRGEHMEIGTYVKHSLQSEISGNIIDLCPVGALTSKPYRFTARPWELKQYPSIAPHDCLGSNIYVHARRNEVMRVVPHDNESINETWLSDRDRFSYLGLNSEDRLAKPMIKKDGQWQETDWQTALEFAVKGLQKILNEEGAQQVGGLISPSATTEECFLFQKWLRGLKVANIDHRLQQIDFRNENFVPALAHPQIPYAELENQQAIFLIGSHLTKEQPLAAVRVRKAALRGAEIMAINPVDCDFNCSLTEKIICSPARMMSELAAIAKAAGVEGADVGQVSEKAQKIATTLQAKENKTFIVGAWVLHHPQAASLCALIELIAQKIKANVFYMTSGANSAGASLVGALPKSALSTQAMFKEMLSAYILLGVEPELDCANPQQAQAALRHAKFVVSLSPYMTEAMRDYANVILPITPFTEMAGTFVNVEGRWQTFKGCVTPFGESRPGWKVLRVLANLCDVHGFDYQDVEEVLADLKVEIKKHSILQTQENKSWNFKNDSSLDQSEKLNLITEWPMYRVDGLVRRATALQQAASGEKLAVRINSALAQKLDLLSAEKVMVSLHENAVSLPLMIDDRIAAESVYIPNGYAETALLGDAGESLKLLKI